MAGSTARVARALMAAGGIALISASAATAATFKSDSGKLAPAPKTGVTASGGTLAFTGTANPTGSTNFAGQINFDSGQATGLKAPGKLTLTHSGHTATVKVTKISGTTLTASVNGTSHSFPLSLTTPPKANATFTGVKVSGVVVTLSSADATALNNALKTSAYKSGAKFGTLGYNGIDRVLIEKTGGPLTLCNDAKFDAKNAANGVTASPISPATPTASPCTGTNDDTFGIDFPEPGKTLGFLDTATGHGRITLKGGIKDTQGGTTGEFKNPILDILGTNGSNSDLRATVFGNGLLLGQQTVASAKFTAAPTITITKSGGTFSSAADSVTVALNSTGASLLHASFCSTGCGTHDYKAGDKIGYAGGTTSFK